MGEPPSVGLGLFAMDSIVVMHTPSEGGLETSRELT